jgi:hypothetical protein
VQGEGWLPARALLGRFAVVRKWVCGHQHHNFDTVTGNDGRRGLAGLAERFTVCNDFMKEWREVDAPWASLLCILLMLLPSSPSKATLTRGLEKQHVLCK